MHKWIVLLFLVLILVIVLRVKVVEHFEYANPIDQYSTNGVSKCRLLSGTLPTLGTNAYSAMIDYVDTGRIQQLKRTAGTVTSDNPSCYFLDDEEEDIQDYLLAKSQPDEPQKCDINNLIFKNNPMFNRVYTDITSENTLKRTVGKCVMELNSNNITPTNIKRFFDNVNDTDCDQLLSQMNMEMNVAQSNQMAAHTAYTSFYPTYTLNQNNYVTASNAYDQCIIDRYTNSNNYTMILDSNNTMISRITSKRNDIQVCDDNTDILDNTKTTYITNLTVDRDSNAKWFQDERVFTQNCDNYIQKANDAAGVANFNASTSIGALTTCKTSYKYISDSNVKCASDLISYTANAVKRESEYDACKPNIIEYSICEPKRKQCIIDLEKCRTESRVYSEKYSFELESHTVCKDKTAILNAAKLTCGQCNQTLNVVKTNTDTQIDQQLTQINGLTGQWNSCSSELALQTTKFDELQKRNAALYNEIDELKKSCRKVETDGLSNSIAVVQNQIGKNVDAMIDTTKNKTCPSNKFNPLPFSTIPLRTAWDYPPQPTASNTEPVIPKV